MLELLTIAIAMLFAANIGASGSAAAMGEAYGSGAIRRRVVALGLVALGMFAGAVIAGGHVTETISHDIVPEASFTMALALVMLLAATVPLAVANFLGIPLSTSEVTVGALIGIGIAVGGANYGFTALIVASWLVLPTAAFLLAAVGAKLLHKVTPALSTVTPAPLRSVFSLVLVVGGVYTAFAAGANNVANAIGPLVAVGTFDASRGLFIGGSVVALGALLFGARVLQTNSKGITQIKLSTGILVTSISGTLVLVASLMGLPVPLAQAKTGAIMGVGFGTQGRRALGKQVIRDIGTVWLLSPVVSMLMAYVLAHFAMDIAPEILRKPLSYALAAGGVLVVAFALLVVNRPRLSRSYNTLRRHADAVRRLGVMTN